MARQGKSAAHICTVIPLPVVAYLCRFSRKTDGILQMRQVGMVEIPPKLRYTK